MLALVTPALAAPCVADVENEGAKLNGHHLMTTWHVKHNAERGNATVTFDYRVHYRNARGTTLSESGFFNEYVRGRSGQYTKENVSSSDPVEILSVEFSRVECRD